MAGPFDGLAAALNQTFGAAVTIIPLVGPQRTTRGIFREFLRVVEVSDGKLLHARVPGLQVRKDDAAGIEPGAKVRSPLQPGKTYTVLATTPDVSPGNTFLIVDLEEDDE